MSADFFKIQTLMESRGYTVSNTNGSFNAGDMTQYLHFMHFEFGVEDSLAMYGLAYPSLFPTHFLDLLNGVESNTVENTVEDTVEETADESEPTAESEPEAAGDNEAEDEAEDESADGQEQTPSDKDESDETFPIGE